jgi:MFS family permease
MFFEPLATLMLKRFSPSVWMSRIMFTWGIISMCQGASQNYAGILACRFFLGAAEAGFYPGVLLVWPDHDKNNRSPQVDTIFLSGTQLIVYHFA